MTKTRWGVLVVALFTSFTILEGVVLLLPGQAPTGSLHGRIVDTSSAPVVGARVGIAGAGLRTTTDSSGRFRLEGVPAGKVAIRVASVGYRPIELAGIEIIAGKVTTQEVSLVRPRESIQQIEVSKPVKPAGSRRVPRQEESRRKLMRELYQIAITPMPLRAGRAGMLFDRLLAEDQARRIEAIERLRPRYTPRTGPPVLIATHGDFTGRPGT